LKTWKNVDFDTAMEKYCKYIDSVTYKKDFDYVYVEATKRNDSTEFVIYLCGGSYDFLNEKERIVGFYVYKGFDILLLGDFPNEIVNIKKNIQLSTINKIILKRYPGDYEKFLIDEHSVGPLIYDYMNMTLIFKGEKLIKFKRQIF